MRGNNVKTAVSWQKIDIFYAHVLLTRVKNLETALANVTDYFSLFKNAHGQGQGMVEAGPHAEEAGRLFEGADRS